jgi:hypothetical protein
MKTFRSVIPVLFLFILSSAGGQEINVSGSGSGYKGVELRIFSLSDPVTKRLKPLLRINADEKSSFSFRIISLKMETIFIKTGMYNFYLYVEPGKKYEVSLLPFIKNPDTKQENPFYEETRIIPDVINEHQDVNNLIRIFDSDFNPVFNEVANRIFLNFKREEIPGLTDRLRKYIVTDSVPFYTDYVRYRISMLNQITLNSDNERLKTTSFVNDSFKPENPAYIDLVDQLFAGYITGLRRGPGKNGFNRALAESSFKMLREVVKKDNKIFNDQLIDYVILSNLHNMYYSGELPSESTRMIISEMEKDASSSYLKDLASIVISRMEAFLPGNFPPDFLLRNSEGKQVSIKDFRGKYIIMNFARSDNYSSVTEFGIINRWQKKYGKYLQLVTILSDPDFKSGIEKMNAHGFSWIFLDGSSDDFLEYQYEVKVYPSFLLLDREGKIIADPCPYPSEDLESTIVNVLQRDKIYSGSEDR